MPTLTHRLYEIWLEEGTDYETPFGPPSQKAIRAANLFYLRSGEEVLTYHIRMSQESWKLREVK